MFTLRTKIIFSIFVVLLLFYSPLPTGAVEESINIKNESINPGSFYYTFKRLWEKGAEKLKFNKQSKIIFYQSQLKTRLAELNYVVENKLLSEVQTSSERFAYQAGILTEELVKENKGKSELVKEFDQFSIFLDKLRDKYPANTSFWMLVQHDINTLTILSERLK